MTAFTLHAHEVRRLLSHGSVLVVRPVKPQPVQLDTGLWYWQPPRLPQRAPEFVWTDALDTPWWIIAIHAGDCPLGAPGTEHWVRETWVYLSPEPEIRMHANARLLYRVLYRADGDNPLVFWRSPVTMPRWASRFDVTVRDVRVLRVWSLQYHDNLTQGFYWRDEDGPCQWFMDDWNARHGKQYPYAANPFCWMVLVSRS